MNGDDIINNCINCNSEYPFGISKNNYLNCYKNCTYYYYFDKFGNYTCTETDLCPEEYNKLIIDKRECINNCELDNEYKYEFINKCYSKCPKELKESINNKYYCVCDEEKPFVIIETEECVEYCDINTFLNSCIINYIGEIYEENNLNFTEENKEKLEEIKKAQEIKIQDIILKNFEKGFTLENYDTSELDKGNDLVTKLEKMVITLTTTDNQKKNKNDNSSKVDIGQCEDILRGVYNITEDKKLYMKKIDVFQEGMKIPKIEYDIYGQLNESNLIKLNKSYCNNVKAEISVHVVLTENIDKYNTSSDYYNDICYPSASDSGTDIILKDRKNEYLKGNYTVCQDGCDFTKYDYNTLKAICSCDIRETSPSYALMKIDKEKLFKNFIDINNIANINILKCYQTLFSKNGIKKNLGFLIIIPIIIFHFISLILLLTKSLTIIKNLIKDIIFGIKNWKLVQDDKKAKQIKIENEKFKKEKEEKINIKKKDKKNIMPKKKANKQKKNLNPPKNVRKQNKTVVVNSYSNLIINKHDTLKTMKKEIINQNNIKELPQKEIIIQKTFEIMAYNDEELNQLSYPLALRSDNRTYCEYYKSLIKTKHNLIFSFFYSKDYNSRIIKIDLFFITFICEFAINTLFFDDDSMHKIYEEKGKFDFLYQLPQIIYSTMISYALNILLNFLALSEDYILDLKKNKNDINVDRRYAKIYKKLKIALMIYFIISLILLLFFWYYISMFCAVYKNTQTHLIKDTFISLGTSFLYPFGIYLIPGFFRIPALSNKRNKRECLYNISKFIQMV